MGLANDGPSGLEPGLEMMGFLGHKASPTRKLRDGAFMVLFPFLFLLSSKFKVVLECLERAIQIQIQISEIDS